MKKPIFLLILFALSISPAIAACHTVTPSGSGSQTGADWNNAFAGLPSTLVRGDTYYLADGNYGSSLSLDQADSGTQVITIKKAQTYDHCTDTGWNASTMGSAQAVWQWQGGPIAKIGSDYWTINGNSNDPPNTIGCGGVATNPPSTMAGAAPNPAGCGIKIDDSTCTSTATDACTGGNGVINGGGQYVTWKSVEWQGSGINPNEPYFWESSLSASHQTVTHSYLHNFGTTTWTYGLNHAIFSYNYDWGGQDTSVNHGEALQDSGSDCCAQIYANVFRDWVTNGILVFVDPVTGTHDQFAFYDNVDYCTTYGNCRHNDGEIACINSSQTCTNFTFVQNTIINCTLACGLNSTNAGTYTWENNLYYHSNVSYTLGGSTFTADYNSYIDSGSPGNGSHDINSMAATPVPFANWNSSAGTLSGLATLASSRANWTGRAALSSPYTLDAASNKFVTARGAYELPK